MPLKLKLGSPLAPIIRIPRCPGVCSRFQSTSSTDNQHSDKANSDNYKQQVPRVKTVRGNIGLHAFRKSAWVSETPLLLRASQNFPAVRKWFQYDDGNSHNNFSQYLKEYEDTNVPYELTIAHGSRPSNLSTEHSVLSEFLQWLRESSEYKDSYLPALVDVVILPLGDNTEPNDNSSIFQQHDAPLGLIMAACQFNETKTEPTERIKNLYVAQCDLSFLPESLLQDLPIPTIVKHAGRGDIYGSSIWLGLQPTFTSLHRDPNPNLFCQLVGSKKIRLMTPNQGDGIYAHVRRELGSPGNSRFRGTEMMGDPECELLYHAVWENESVDEVSLGSGDALFIPKGWWHSVASSGKEGELNASVNWWFR
ncbi:Clavaminate synthase-like protein [Hypoxylon sp. FL1857]|nr:Clavaminate synthase-like protein [Hypoxylon sp. FL1857]